MTGRSARSRDALDPPAADAAQRMRRCGLAAQEVGLEDVTHAVRVHAAVEDARPPGRLDLDERLREAHAEAADGDHLGGDVKPGQLSSDRVEDLAGAGSAATGSQTHGDDRSITSVERVPPLAGGGDPPIELTQARQARARHRTEIGEPRCDRATGRGGQRPALGCLDERLRLGRRLTAVDAPVEDDDRCQRTRAEAGHRLQGVGQVRRRAACLDAEMVLELAELRPAAADVARGPAADGDRARAPWLEVEL